MLFVGTSIIHPSTEGVFLLCNILDLLIYSYYITREIKVHERPEKEVASEMGITIGNLRVKMTRTKKWLCQHFADKARERGFL